MRHIIYSSQFTLVIQSICPYIVPDRRQSLLSGSLNSAYVLKVIESLKNFQPERFEDSAFMKKHRFYF